MHTSAMLKIGRYQGSFQVHLCNDSVCNVEYAGSPVSLPYDLTVTPAPLQAYANTTTAATVHWGGVIPNNVIVSVLGSISNWTASSNASWLNVLNGAGVNAGSFSVSYAPQGLAVGNYTD